jgi:hypothetical protein
MEKVFALIKDNEIVNIIVADDKFIASISEKGYETLRIDELSADARPGIGWLRTDEQAPFEKPVPVEIPVEPEPESATRLKEVQQRISELKVDIEVQAVLGDIIELIVSKY